jgi:hypothetical protein
LAPLAIFAREHQFLGKILFGHNTRTLDWLVRLAIFAREHQFLGKILFGHNYQLL